MFGSIESPYVEDYRPVPFDRRFVRHLPGWYAQKHPDEDWAETFAVCADPDTNWHVEYAACPEARAKLAWCAEALASIAGSPPLVTSAETDEDGRAGGHDPPEATEVPAARAAGARSSRIFERYARVSDCHVRGRGCFHRATATP